MNTEVFASGNQVAKKKTENPWASLIFNVVAPSFVLMKLSGPEKLGPTLGLVVALAFPITYTLWDFFQRRTLSFIAAIGFVAILTKGGLGLLKLNHFWFAVNEAAVPCLIAVALWVSQRMGRPLVGTFLMNDAVMNVSAIDAAIKERQQESAFAKLMVDSTYLLIASFLVSAVLNFVLAWVMLKSPVGSPEFNEEMGVMTAVSMPVIMICSSSILVYALWRMLAKLKVLTGMEMEAMFHQKESKASKA